MSEDTIHPENSSKYEALKVKKGIPQPEAMNPNIAARLKNIRKKEVTTNHCKEVINCYLPSSGHSIRIDITK